ncbi:MAG: SIS domain-containing protein [Lachnospiraceae bacterium]|nr:SIS domain-containing protein [Lachnospiraceae bacterium]
MVQEYYEKYTEELNEALKGLDKAEIQKLWEKMEEIRLSGGKIFVLGNGGSAAAASHWICDFSKGINTDSSRRLKIYSLADNLSVATALGNDFSYDEIFSEQLKNVLTKEDLVISLSVSGSSSNLVNAHLYAKEKGAFTAAIIGDYHGKLEQVSDLVITVPSRNYGIVEDIHMTIDHVVSQYMRICNEKKEAEGGHK